MVVKTQKKISGGIKLGKFTKIRQLFCQHSDTLSQWEESKIGEYSKINQKIYEECLKCGKVLYGKKSE